jgi:outer membrane receptor protein involved in Fe transport
MNYKYILFLVLTVSFKLNAQPGGPRNGGPQNRSMLTGRMYGKVVDDKTGKGIEDASVQFWQEKFDSVSKQNKLKLLGGQLTEGNGDFSVEGLPLMGPIKLKVTALGFITTEKTISFDITPGKAKDMMSLSDKDIGNIKITANVKELEGVVVKADEPTVKMTIDKKIYNVDKNLTATGGNAQDAMKNIPAVNVDIDGNVTMRNAAPTIFVDGRPTTLTLDQIPADNIQSIEVITNPSVKYDASGGMAGIINIVLKKNKRMGYNGSVRAGIDKRGKINAGLDLNIREKKLNFFVGSSVNQRKSIAEGWSNRDNYFAFDTTNTYQKTYSEQNNLMYTNRFGFDYFIDNRNTITLSTNYTVGNHKPSDNLDIQYRDFPDSNIISLSERNTNSFRNFRNWGNALLYKHLFPKTGKELTADINYNAIKAVGGADAITHYSDGFGNPYRSDSKQRQDYNGGSSFFTAQVDFTNPLNDYSKIDIGVRSAYRIFVSNNNNSLYDAQNLDKLLVSQKNNYEYTDLVNAAYVNYSRQKKKWGIQTGLRIESSFYKGTLKDTVDKNFAIQYPISLFPSFAASYKIKENNDININLNRRINRPGFFQLMPYIDFSDSLNLSRGNPNLRPEFTYASEISYLYSYKNNQSFMANIYAKMSTGLITRYILSEYNDLLKKDIIVSSYENALSSSAYGIELVSKNTYKKWFDVTSNINIYQSQINTATLTNKQLSWFSRVNANFKILKTWSLQISGEYFSKMAFQQGGGGGGMMGGGMGGTQNTAQGYTMPNYSVDAAIKKEFLKSKTLSVTLNFMDIFHTKRMYSVSSSGYFALESFRQRDWQFFRLNISYRFGKFDASLFKRKNNKSSGDGEGMM